MFSLNGMSNMIFKNFSKISGANDVIAFNSDDNIYELEERDLLLKELLIRKPYDVAFLTTSQTYNRDFISKFLTNNGRIIDTVEKRLASDDYGIFLRFLCSVSHNILLSSFQIQMIYRLFSDICSIGEEHSIFI